KNLSDEDLEKIFYEVELPLVKVMAGMEKEGFKVDKEELISFGEMLSSEIDGLTAKIYEAAGETFNINSPVQLGEVLFEKLELPAGKKTKRGYSPVLKFLKR
ncbi:MAG: DNA polymerase I, partial [Firmicutes bacterium]|nr:DNA polymerase I [Bacillota bacterium]